MSGSMHQVISQNMFKANLSAFTDFNKSLKERALAQNDIATIERLKNAPEPVRFDDPQAILKFHKEARERNEVAKGLIRKYIEAQQSGLLAKAGVTTSLGYNFYDPAAPVPLLYSVKPPFPHAHPRQGKVNDGYGT